jgi:hypothetical protein
MSDRHLGRHEEERVGQTSRTGPGVITRRSKQFLSIPNAPTMDRNIIHEPAADDRRRRRFERAQRVRVVGNLSLTRPTTTLMSACYAGSALLPLYAENLLPIN